MSSVKDQFEKLIAMKKLAETAYCVNDYMSCCDDATTTTVKTSKQPQHESIITPDCRFKMVEWCYKIVDACNVDREMVAIGMSMMDRFAATSIGQEEIMIDRSNYQLSVLAALYTSVKVHAREVMSAKMISELSQGVYTEEHIEAMELKLLQAIQWRVHPPTALSFEYELLSLIPPADMTEEERDTILDLARFQLDLSVLYYDFVPVPASHMAVAALSNAVQSLSNDEGTWTVHQLWLQSLCRVVGVDVHSEYFHDIRTKLYEAIQNKPETGLISQSRLGEVVEEEEDAETTSDYDDDDDDDDWTSTTSRCQDNDDEQENRTHHVTSSSISTRTKTMGRHHSRYNSPRSVSHSNTFSYVSRSRF